MNWDTLLARFREGRNFVTNGPVLMTFHVNGEPMGSVVQVAGGRPYRAHLTAEVTSHVPVKRVELLRNGQVIESKTVSGVATGLRLEHEVEVTGSCWFAARVVGEPSRGFASTDAHSGPVYIHVDGKSTLVKQDLELMIRWVDRFEALLEERNNFGPGDNRQRARAMIAQARAHFQGKLAKAQ